MYRSLYLYELAQVAQTKSKGRRVSALATARTGGSIVSVPRTTTSSNAVVISAKHNAPKKQIETQSLDEDAASCGFLEDEREEREAALSSPIKGKQRLNSKVSHILVLEIALF